MNLFNTHCSQNPLFKKGALVLVIGSGLSGEAAACLAASLGAKVRVLEKNEAAITPEFRAQAEALGIEIQTGEHDIKHFVGATLAIISPGVQPKYFEAFLAQANLGSGLNSPIPLLGELEFASRFTNTPIIAVTGTSGKTTTVSLMAAMLEEAGKKVFLGGNIGTPLSQYILSGQSSTGQNADVLVLEVSSFQLMTCKNFHPTVAVLINLGLNHLDWHKDMAEYTDAKFKMFEHQTHNELAILNADLKDIAEKYQLKGIKLFVDANNLKTNFSQSKLLGLHNRINEELAFLAVGAFGVSLEQATRAVAKFKPLENRLEPICEKEAILYVNDTKSTTVDSLEAALRSFSESAVKRPVLLLAGGKFKGGDLEALRPLLQKAVKQVALFGASREHFEKAWAGFVPLSWHPNLDEAFEKLKNDAEAGDVILLSPAAASYDLYKNYKERGKHFRRLAEGV